MKTKAAARAGPGSNDRKFWTEFLVLYQSQSALWDMGNEFYKDRCAKIKCYDLLKEKLREQLPNATRDDVLRRINIFRTNYRRERMRAHKYRERGSNYQTSLWYFKLLSFLEPQILIKSRTRKLDQKDLQEKQEFCNLSQFKVEGSAYHTNMDIASNLKRQPLEDVSFVGENGVGDMEDLEYFFEDDGRINNPCSSEMKNNNSRHEMGEINEVQYKYTTNSIAEDFEQSSTHSTRLDEYVVTDEDGQNVDITQNAAHTIEDTTTSFSVYPTEIHHKSNEQHNATKPAHQELKTSKIVQTKLAPPFQQMRAEKTGDLSTASEILARSWAVQYDEMSVQQKIYARKEIAEILFAGCMGTLGSKNS